MGLFKTIARRFPDGAPLDGVYPGDNNQVTGPAVFDRVAPPLAGDANAPLGYRFLYWDTGRHVTTKRHVKWMFNNPTQWGTWTAVAWYGVLSNDPTENDHLIEARAHWIGSAPVDPTPISDTSTFSSGPAGEPAWPWGGSPYVATTQWGAARVRAASFLDVGGVEIDFEGWQELVLGGDDNGEFDESDTGDVGGGQDVYDTTLNPSIERDVGAGGSTKLLAAYAAPVTQRVRPPRNDRSRFPPQIIPIGDAGPLDILRQIANRANVERGLAAEDAFASLVEGGRTMAEHELSQAIAATQSVLRRGEAALQSLQAIRAVRSAPK